MPSEVVNTVLPGTVPTLVPYRVPTGRPGDVSKSTIAADNGAADPTAPMIRASNLSIATRIVWFLSRSITDGKRSASLEKADDACSISSHPHLSDRWRTSAIP